MTAPSVHYYPQALSNADVWFERLRVEVPWDSRMHARRTASFGRPYNYSGQQYPAVPMLPVIAQIEEEAARIAGHPFDNCLCNLYETGANTMGFHFDSYERLTPTSWIAIASLGAARTLTFRNTERTRRVEYVLEGGSLLLMNRETQRDWRHAIEPSSIAGARISLTFRQFAA